MKRKNIILKLYYLNGKEEEGGKFLIGTYSSDLNKKQNLLLQEDQSVGMPHVFYQ